MASSELRTRRRGLVLVVLAVAAIAGVLRWRPVDGFALQAFDDLSQSATAFVGAGFCFLRAMRCVARYRVSWALFAAATAAWGAGELVWAYYELVARREVPFPSLADAGFLLFPVLALAGLLVRPSASRSVQQRLRLAVDGVMIAAAVFNLGWVTSLGVTFDDGTQDAFAFAVSVAYPASDIVMLALAIGLVAYSSDRVVTPLVAVALAAMGIADSGFTYLTAIGQYGTGTLTDLGWSAAFLLVALAAFVDRAGAAPGRPQPSGTDHGPSPAVMVLPSVVVLAGGGGLIYAYSRGTLDALSLALQGTAVLALLVRQWLTTLDNRRLVGDVTAQQAELRHRAFYDGLTGLANRALFHDRLGHTLALREREQRPIAVLFCDLDDFKIVNDSLGHDAGDVLLTEVGRRLVACTRTADTVARLGGDEFAVLCEDEFDAGVVAARILAALAEPCEIAGRRLSIRVSVGVVELDADDPTPSVDTVLKRADIAMYTAKQQSRSAFVRYDDSMDAAGSTGLDERLRLAEDVHAGRIDVALQPILRIDGSPLGYEALARWTCDGVAVAPAHFVPLAERAGLLPDLDLLVTERALRHLVALDDGSLVSVNLGLATLGVPEIAELIGALLRNLDVPAERLIVEVPEWGEYSAPDLAVAIDRLRALGVRIAVDDFGVGYSNLSRLGRLVPDLIKLDRSLVVPLGATTEHDDSGAALRIVSSAIALAHELGATVVAEGIEDAAQLHTLRALGCDAAQGFLLGRPALLEAAPAAGEPSPVVG